MNNNNTEGVIMKKDRGWKTDTIRVEWDKESDDVYGLPDELSFKVRMVVDKNRLEDRNPKDYQSQLEKCVLKNEKEYESEVISFEEVV